MVNQVLLDYFLAFAKKNNYSVTERGEESLDGKFIV